MRPTVDLADEALQEIVGRARHDPDKMRLGRAGRQGEEGRWDRRERRQQLLHDKEAT